MSITGYKMTVKDEAGMTLSNFNLASRFMFVHNKVAELAVCEHSKSQKRLYLVLV